MICKKTRFYKKKYCSSDFQYNIIIYKKSLMNENKINQIDAVNKKIIEFSILANITINNYDIESGGELMRAGSTIEVITHYQGQTMPNNFVAVYQDIKNNSKNWFIQYLGENYQVLNIDLIDGKSFYNSILAARVA